MNESVDNSEKGLKITGQHVVLSGGKYPRVKLKISPGHKTEERYPQRVGVHHKIKTEMNDWVLTFNKLSAGVTYLTVKALFAYIFQHT